MGATVTQKILLYCIASIWLLNGLYCKVLNQVPRHEMIVASILSNDHSRLLTILIGLSEIVMAIWVVSRFSSKLCAWTQIIVIILMNILEIIFVPELLLWGGLNFWFALIFVLLIYYTEFSLLSRSIES